MNGYEIASAIVIVLIGVGIVALNLWSTES